MKFDDLLRWFGDLPWFDFEMVLLVSGEADPCVHTELYRWRRGGKIIELRRGLFVFAEPWRKGLLESGDLAAALAAPIYAPSYLTGRWVLEREGFIRVADAAGGAARGEGGVTAPTFTCATMRPARIFENAFGTYRYDTLPRDLLFGTVALVAGSEAGNAAWRAAACRVALPEKAFLDLCFFEGGEWDEERLEGLGLAVAGSAKPVLDGEMLSRLAERTGRPRLIKAAKAYCRMAGK